MHRLKDKTAAGTRKGECGSLFLRCFQERLICDRGRKGFSNLCVERILYFFDYRKVCAFIIKMRYFLLFFDFFVIIFKKNWTKEIFMLCYTLGYYAL